MGKVLMIAAILFTLCDLHAQDSAHAQQTYLHAGKIGLGVDGITDSPNLLMKYFFNNQLAMEVIVGLNLEFPGEDAPPGQTKVNGVTLRGGLSILLHITRDQVSPYIGVEGIFRTVKDAGFYTTVPGPKDIFFGGAVFGAECFFNERFTLGIKQTIGTDIWLKRNVPKETSRIFISTSTLFTGRFYFN